MVRGELETVVLQSITLNGILDQVLMLWDLIKEPLIVPLLKLMVNICLVMSVLLFIERVYMAIVKVFIKLLRRKPEKNYKWEAMQGEDLELGSSAYPMVLVQIPMYNEREVQNYKCTVRLYFIVFCLHSVDVLIFFCCFEQVYQFSIGAACVLSWPSDRIIVQVLDDSTDLAIKVNFTLQTQSLNMLSLNGLEILYLLKHLHITNFAPYKIYLEEEDP